MVLNMLRYSDSERGSVHSPIFMPSCRLMSVGTVASIMASMDSKPQYVAMANSSAFVALLCRRSKESSGRSACAVMVRIAPAAKPGVRREGTRCDSTGEVRLAMVAKQAVWV